MLAPDPDRLRDRSSDDLPLSAMLRALCNGPPGPIKIRDIVGHFGHRAFGAMLSVFSAPNLLPLPPGSSSVLSLPLVLLAPQVALGRASPWLPKAVAERTIDRATLRRTFDKVIPGLERVEKLLAPRLDFMFGPVGDRLIGLTCFLLALVLILPIPFGNFLPAAAVAALSLGMTQRDGAMALIGYLLTAISVAVLVLSAGAVILAFRHITQFFGL
jgi:hypothetical protein